ncbi:tRNA pseudouridine(38-40) synthase TruA [Clostridium tarantellae]|uniref:tRNA pseudouridine synthase A n=1 Tax=Clostridium tarantellae TaxID=39493 RepID=A0A6I1MRA2_9CLOT|nr:tRNA pseudouridine(38-40) synthase TruA [Clostridium tarantellae]MPQ42819.1 tRNA pseudouridine(38-40) synthase TruA [Clostridium tarantellae]
MRNIKIVIEYDGTNYCGWQKQKKEDTIQERIESAISKVIKEDIEIIGSSRTDSGVHAKAFVANFKTNSKIPAEKFREAINSKLPKDITIMYSEEVREDFHARYSCEGKTYCYTILNRLQSPAIERNFVYHVKEKLDINLMQDACKYFIGTHDFKAFKSTGSSVKTSVRTITDLYIEAYKDKVKIYISANGFLYNMVRIIVGTLLMVGTKKIEPQDIKKIIEDGIRENAGKCVPAMGLCLEKVFY